MLIKYPKIFPNKFIDEGLFLNLYGWIVTRSFSYDLPSHSLIPMADKLNHFEYDVSYEIINIP